MIGKIFAYVWDCKNKKIEKLEQEARHPYAKKMDEVEHNRLVRKRRVFPFRKKSV